MKLGIGIDTGGTYTDAVLYDFESRSILGSAKALTTRGDLTDGILAAIDALPAGLAQRAEVVSLSTTLATNACVEGRGGRAKLIFFGGERDVIDRYGAQYGLPPSREMYLQDSYTDFSGGASREPDWALFRRGIGTGFDGLDGVGIVEINAMRNGAAVEKKAKEIFQEKYDVPVVCGHELFSELNCLQRGSSTLLNAGLFPIVGAFLAAVKRALAARGIRPASLVVVRSDGGLMSEKFASLRPVETLLCGPAASAVGCAKLTDSPDSIVVDMGGTTTDIAVVRGGVPVSATGGVSIGKWKTFVSGLYIRTVGLGGDSAVHYRGSQLRLEEYRVVPLCVAAAQYPSVADDLRALPKRKHTRFLYEHYMLLRDVGDDPGYTAEERALCRALREKPLLLADAAAAVGRDVYTLRADRLIRDGAVQLCGLTPTDVMHLRGDFREYDAEASRLGAEFAAFNLGVSVDELCELVYREVRRRLYVNLVKAMLENKRPAYRKTGFGADVERLILESFDEASRGEPDRLLSAGFRTNYTLVGAGAPVAVFLNDVARLLGTRAVIPAHHEVANALGAIVGSVSAACTVEIRPDGGAGGSGGYLVYGNSGKRVFEREEDAVRFASAEAEEKARSEAEKRGARGEIAVSSEIRENRVRTVNGIVDLGAAVTARATGTMGF